MRTFRTTYKARDGKTRKTSKYYVELRDHQQIVRRFPAFANKEQSEALGRQIERLVGCRMTGDPPKPDLIRWLESIPSRMRDRFVKVGLIDKSRAAGGKLLLEHVQCFESHLVHKGDTEKQAKQTASRVRKVFTGCHFVVWSDVSPGKVEAYLSARRLEDLSKQTANYYLKAVQHFARWMVADGRASMSPIEHIRPISVGQSDKRRVRRALEADEVRRLLEVTAASEPRWGMTGPERSLCYRLACETGLRANELRMLQVQDFDLYRCIVTVRSRSAKNRKEATLPILPGTATELRAMFANKLPGARVFRIPAKPIQLLRPDLEAAEIAYRDEAGRYADFHSLRHTTGTLLALAGVHPRTAQEIMRHSSIDLTMRTYTHVKNEQLSEAIKGLPDLSIPSRQSQKNIKTGTDGMNVKQNCLGVLLGASGGTTMDSHRTVMDASAKTNPVHANENGVFERGRRGSNPQPSDRQSDAVDLQDTSNKALTKTPKNVLALRLAQIAQKYPKVELLVKSWPDLTEQQRNEILIIAGV